MMNTDGFADSPLDAHFNGRVLRAALGVSLAATFLAGIWVTPAWIFTASVASILMVTCALLGTRILDGGFKPAGGDAPEFPVYQRKLGNAWRLVRGVTGTAAMGSVLGDALIDAYVLDAFEIFVLNMGGAYLAMIAVAWDPARTMFSVAPPPAETAAPPTVGSMPGTGPVAQPQPAPTEHAA